MLLVGMESYGDPDGSKGGVRGCGTIGEGSGLKSNFISMDLTPGEIVVKDIK